MSAPNSSPPAAGLDPVGDEERRSLLREVLLVAGGVTLACSLLSWLQDSVPLLREYLYAIVAGLFFYLPFVFLRRRGMSTRDVGLTTRPRVKGLLFALGAILIVFPPFALGFHFWQGVVHDNAPDFQLDSYRRWPLEWEGKPSGPPQDSSLELFVHYSELQLRWAGLRAGGRTARSTQGPEIELQTDGRLELLSKTSGARVRQGGRRLAVTGKPEGSLLFRVRGGDELSLRASLGARPLARETIRVGGARAPAGAQPIEGHRSLYWLLILVLNHLLLVALPEELFYRGYLQTQLDRVWPRRWRVLGVEVGVSILVVSVIFALGHYLVDFRVQRLAVFFPSLLFGWMRAGTRSLMAPILFHASSNILADLLTKGYVH